MEVGLLLWQVVTPAQITFFVDGKNSSAAHLARPITDCVGQALEIGDDDIPQLGEITFARALSTTRQQQQTELTGVLLVRWIY